MKQMQKKKEANFTASVAASHYLVRWGQKRKKTH